MEKQNTPQEKFLLRIDKDLKEKATKAAKDSDRSLNGHIIAVLKKDLKIK